jgi:Tol biopolymer transport system component/C-terminal processing protease CtpA/Prc
MSLACPATHAEERRPAAWPAGVPSFAEPAPSPDGSEIAFVSGGDIWTVPAAGGEARLLVAHPATESRPLYSPDGRQLAFVSTRTGNGDIYVLTIDTGAVRRLTFDDAPEQLDAWSHDGRWIYFSSAAHDISAMNDVYRVRAEGGTPLPVTADRYANEYFAAPSPDGATLAFTARGITSSQWWRKGHSHLDECEIWLKHGEDVRNYQRLTNGGAKELWPMWNPDGGSIYYVSDRSRAENLWVRPLEGPARQLTHFQEGRLLWPTISHDGRVIAFERDFGIWKFDTTTGQAGPVSIRRRGAPTGQTVEHRTFTADLRELALAPDGKKVAFIVHGEVFAASAKEGGTAERVTHTSAAESQVCWAPDSRRLAYISDRDGTSHLFLYDFGSNTETQLTRTAGADHTPQFSPDGKAIAFLRNGHELRAFDLASKQERLLATGHLERPPLHAERPFVWSPDSQWLAFRSITGHMYRNVHIVPAGGGAERPVTFLANAGGETLSWAPDGTALFLDTNQRTENGQVARVDLLPRTPKFREDEFRDLFREETPRTIRPPPKETTPAPAKDGEHVPAKDQEAKPAAKPVKIEFEEIRRRLTLLPLGVDVRGQSVSPDGKWLLVTAVAAGQENLYVYSLDELAKEPAVAKQLTSTAGVKLAAQFAPDNKEVYYLDEGHIHVVTVADRHVRTVSVSAEMDVDFAEEKQEVFHQAWTYLRDNFYDPRFHGVDWDRTGGAYAPHVAGAATPDEMRRLIALMVGELNASHLGITGPASARRTTTGRLGLRFDRPAYEKDGRLRVTEVLPLGPAALAGGVKSGDSLLAVDGTSIGLGTNLDTLLEHKNGRRVVLTVRGPGAGEKAREVVVRPIDDLGEKGLLYRDWVERKRAYVAQVSKGRLGYVHMLDMSLASLQRLHLDLDALNQARKGVVIDVRNNNGGFVNVYAIDVLSRRDYLTMTVRGFPPTPARTMLGQRTLETPKILVTNQHSLSDAEDFTEGFRALGLGKVVGEPTAGWIIYTTNVPLLDGSLFRIPFIQVTARDGTIMEMHPRPVDISIVRPIGESYTDHDCQLDTAVQELLGEIDGRNAASGPGKAPAQSPR